jgi:hypothetical protein
LFPICCTVVWGNQWNVDGHKYIRETIMIHINWVVCILPAVGGGGSKYTDPGAHLKQAGTKNNQISSRDNLKERRWTAHTRYYYGLRHTTKGKTTFQFSGVLKWAGGFLRSSLWGHGPYLIITHLSQLVPLLSKGEASTKQFRKRFCNEEVEYINIEVFFFRFSIIVIKDLKVYVLNIILHF